MAGYAVTARVERPTLRACLSTPPPPDDRPVGPPVAHETRDLVGRPLDVVLRERWDDVRASWAQTTFYLFDANSWR